MNPKIKQILEDLYNLDPSLKINEEKIIKIIENMLVHKPEISIDSVFKDKLKNELLTSIESSKKSKRKLFTLNNFIRNILFFVSGAVMASMVMFIIFPTNFEQVINIKKNQNEENKEIVINNTEDFSIAGGKVEMSIVNEKGEKIDASGNVLTGSSDFNIGTSSSITMSLSDDKNIKQTNNTDSKTNKSVQNKKIALLEINKSEKPFDKIQLDNNTYSNGGMVGSSLKQGSENPNTTKMMNPSTETMSDMATFDSVVDNSNYGYKFVFSGSKLDLTNTKIFTYKREKISFDKLSLLSVLQSNSKILPINLEKLDNGEIKNFTIGENVEYGLQAYIDLENANISFQKDYSRWPKESISKKNTTLTDKEIMDITTNFIEKYNISLQSFSSPVIQRGEGIYNIQVTYPLKINGKKVYDEMGNFNGIKIIINEENKKVESVTGIEKYYLQSNEHIITNNFDKILKDAQNGGLNGKNYVNNKSSNTLYLTTPQIAYVKIISYSNNENQEFIIPCIVFDTINTTSISDYIPKNIIVPVTDF